MDKPFPAYSGDEPYIFACYAHQDDEVATRIIVSMRKRHTENGNHIHYYPPDSPSVVQE